MKSAEAVPDGRRTKVRNARTPPCLHPPCPPTLNVGVCGDTPGRSSFRCGNIEEGGVKGVCIVDCPHNSPRRYELLSFTRSVNRCIAWNDRAEKPTAHETNCSALCQLLQTGLAMTHHTSWSPTGKLLRTRQAKMHPTDQTNNSKSQLHNSSRPSQNGS